MEDDDLVRRLRRLRRTVDMLQTDLRYGQVNEDLMAEIEAHMERGIASEPRCADLSERVDAVRESTLTPRPQLLTDTARACDRLKDAMDSVLSALG